MENIQEIYKEYLRDTCRNIKGISINATPARDPKQYLGGFWEVSGRSLGGALEALAALGSPGVPEGSRKQ